MDAENYRSQKDSFKQTLLDHHKQCIKAASQLIQVNRDDLLRWVNSVDALAMALSSHILEHDDIKDRFEANERKEKVVTKQYEDKYYELMRQVKDEQKINERFMKEFVDALLSVTREKFVIITILLHRKNYFEEIAYRDGMDDLD